MINLPFQNFDSAGRAVIAFLHKRLGFRLWLVTRTQGEDWIVLQSEDHHYDVVPGTVFRWADSFCSEMIQGNGPRIAPDSDTVPAYAAAPIGQQVEIGAYIGIPLSNADGSVFGTLCAIDPSPQPQSLLAEEELIELLATLLSSILQADLKASEAIRQSERFELEAQMDAMTGLFNRGAWDQLLAKEEERCRQYGHNACVLILDLDDLKRTNDTQGHAAGDILLVQTANALRAATRKNDIVARIGGDEFAVLVVECDATATEVIPQRVQNQLRHLHIDASIGMAARKHDKGLVEAVLEADRLMYEQKHQRYKD